MATSTIKQKYHYVDKAITTGNTLFAGYYYGNDDTYKTNEVLAATVVNSGNGNQPAWVYVMTWTTRVLSTQANNPVTVRFLLKD